MTIEKMNISAIIEFLELPKDSNYLGYVVYLPIEDEFLANLKENKNCIQRLFTRSPELATKYSNFNKAKRHAKLCKQITEIWLAFDIGRKIIVCPVDSEKSLAT